MLHRLQKFQGVEKTYSLFKSATSIFNQQKPKTNEIKNS